MIERPENILIYLFYKYSEEYFAIKIVNKPWAGILFTYTLIDYNLTLWLAKYFDLIKSKFVKLQTALLQIGILKINPN